MQAIENHKILNSHILHSPVNIYNTEYGNSLLFRFLFVHLKKTKKKNLFRYLVVYYLKHISADFPFLRFLELSSFSPVGFLNVKIFWTGRENEKLIWMEMKVVTKELEQ